MSLAFMFRDFLRAESENVSSTDTMSETEAMGFVRASAQDRDRIKMLKVVCV